MTAIGRPVPDPAAAKAAAVGTSAAGTGKDAGRSFATHLQGMIKPSDGSTGFLEDQSDLAAPSAGVAQQASVFNAHGLFYDLVNQAPLSKAATPPTNSVVPRDTSAQMPAPAPLTLLEGQPILDAPTQPAEASFTPEISIAEAATPFGSLTSIAGKGSFGSRFDGANARNRIAQLLAPAEASSDLCTIGADLESDPPVASPRSSRPGMLRQMIASAGTKSAVSVSLQTLDGGHAVMAHVASLGREDRGKLRDRIVALLSKHGMIAQSVRIDGQSTGPATIEKGR